jgi:putative oxidoreductase
MNNDTQLLIARILLSIIFIVAGLQKLFGIEGTAGYIASVGLPAATLLAWAAAIFETVAGIFILIGFQTRYTALLTALFCLFTGFVFHFNLGDQMQTINLMKNIAMAGGFLALASAGPGALSVDAKRG